jgi:hypothetical protein
MVAAHGEAMKAARATGNARCTCCVSYSRCRTKAGLERRIVRSWTRWRRVGDDNRGAGNGQRLLQVLCTREVVHASALRACGSGRVVLARDAVGAGGGDKSGAGRGERPSRAQEVVNMVLGSTAGAGGDSSTLLKSHSVREGDVGGEERQRRVLRCSR